MVVVLECAQLALTIGGRKYPHRVCVITQAGAKVRQVEHDRCGSTEIAKDRDSVGICLGSALSAPSALSAHSPSHTLRAREAAVRAETVRGRDSMDARRALPLAPHSGRISEGG